MKRHLVSAMVLGSVAVGRLLAAQSQPAPRTTFPPVPPLASAPGVCRGECVPCQKGCEINVFLRPQGKDCKVEGLTQLHKIWHIRAGKEARFQFRNDCSTAMDLGVGNFGLHPKETCTGDHGDHATHEKEWKEGRVDKDPFVSGARSVRVLPGEQRPLPLTLLAKPHSPRTYKYAIMVNGKPELDPEIEIERQN